MPITTTLDEVRLLIGDTDSSRPLLYDDEVNYFLAQASDDVNAAAAMCCEALAAKFAREPQSWSADGQSVSQGERVTYYLSLASKLRRAASGGVMGIGLAGAARGRPTAVDTEPL